MTSLKSEIEGKVKDHLAIFQHQCTVLSGKPSDQWKEATTVCSMMTVWLRIWTILFSLPLSDTGESERMALFSGNIYALLATISTETSLSLKEGTPPFSCIESVLILINSNLNLIVTLHIFIFKMFNNFASCYSSLCHYSQYLLPNRFCYSHLRFLWGYLFVPTPVLLPLCTTSVHISLHFSLKQNSVRPTKELHNISFQQLILFHFPGHQKILFLLILLLVPHQKKKTDFSPPVFLVLQQQQ